jgi:hypothetical protein
MAKKPVEILEVPAVFPYPFLREVAQDFQAFCATYLNYDDRLK